MSGRSKVASEDLSRAAVILLRHYSQLPPRELARRIKDERFGTPRTTASPATPAA